MIKNERQNTVPMVKDGMRRWFFRALGFFFAAGCIGALLRLIYVVEMPWLTFKPWLHAHSHVAMLGWLFPALLIALIGQDDRRPPRGFAVWMVISQALVLGMLFSFPVQGYGETSIACSTGQMLVGYVLIGQAWYATRHWPPRAAACSRGSPSPSRSSAPSASGPWGPS
ncbi:MAG: hypothetical protein IPH53_17635 [Flavobacteriales bacterium]|nr:hypothetical protein [Flavobacteriales bacterium]